jgi:hypothetical protein
VERTLLGLGVTRADVLRQGADIDRAGQRLVIEAAADPTSQRNPLAMRALNRQAATAEVINHALSSGDPRAVTLLGRAAVPEPAEAEPEP